MKVPFGRGAAMVSRASMVSWAPIALIVLCGQGPAWAQITAPPTVYPMWVATENAAGEDETLAVFTRVLARYGLRRPEVVDLPMPAVPEIKKPLAAAIEQVKQRDFGTADNQLRRLAADVDEHGGAGLNTAALSDLFLYLAMAIDQAGAPLPEGTAPDPHPNAKDAYLRAALLTPGRELYLRDYPPLARQRWSAAQAEVSARPRGSIVVTGPENALVALDGSNLRPLPATFADLPFGEHLIKVEAPGQAPWSEKVPLALAELRIEVPPMQHLSLDDATAAARARRMLAAHALVGQLRPGKNPTIELALVVAATGRRLNTARVPARGDEAALDAAIMRLDEQARRSELETSEGVGGKDQPSIAIVPASARERPDRDQDPAQDPRAWARHRWPLLTAIGVSVATALVLGLVVATDE